ncbi:hypothetical protein GCM10012286_25190 [Streptomyces lasiicapitis]|uniref:Uncharacterized protein n=1 Tax=Streptomyces lasiicapitis TaxID=1923961 RepID=A0ABQ2LTB7_9ACTN|nr:hypothetical protein GCM10012286_25190 [Streptomyces lasiicapitis]
MSLRSRRFFGGAEVQEVAEGGHVPVRVQLCRDSDRQSVEVGFVEVVEMVQCGQARDEAHDGGVGSGAAERVEGQQSSAEVFLPVTVTVAEQGGFGLFRAQDGIGISLFGGACHVGLPACPSRVRARPAEGRVRANPHGFGRRSPGVVRDLSRNCP